MYFLCIFFVTKPRRKDGFQGGSRAVLSSTETTYTGSELDLEFYSLRKKVGDSGHRIVEVLASSNMAEQQAKLANLEQQDSQSKLWDDTTNAQRVKENV
jgi:hypothetical protein